MNPSSTLHHNIYGLARERSLNASDLKIELRASAEGGYTLVALLATMTLLALFALAAAPSISQQALREREKEAIYRGEQVADAIRAYYLNRTTTLRVIGDQALPTSIEQLLEGIPVPGGSKNRQILRKSAARDPLSSSGEWRFVRPRSQELIDFQRSVMIYAGNVIPTPQNPQLLQLQQFAAPPITSIVDSGTSDTAPGGESSGLDSSGPFVGVASRSRNNSVLYYYGIDRHDRWIFTPLFR
ncbi:MAG TPA: hypothetical protein VMM84_00650 [Pyrinomonadaceae bacterium]|nr:hypothetical protein [Pyrinomonadaceae bacterium]